MRVPSLLSPVVLRRLGSSPTHGTTCSSCVALLCSHSLRDSSPARSVLMGTCGVSDLLLMNKAAATIHTRVLGQALTR